MCSFWGVLTPLKARYASPGLNLPFAGVISITISDSVSPWHLCIVTAQASVNGNCVLSCLKWCFLLSIVNVACVMMYWNNILMYSIIYTCVPCFLSNMLHYQKLLILHSSFPLSGQLSHLLLYPLHHLLTHAATSIFVVIITLALIFIVKTFCRLPVSHGLVGIVTFASSVQSSFFTVYCYICVFFAWQQFESVFIPCITVCILCMYMHCIMWIVFMIWMKF